MGVCGGNGLCVVVVACVGGGMCVGMQWGGGCEGVQLSACVFRCAMG